MERKFVSSKLKFGLIRKCRKRRKCKNCAMFGHFAESNYWRRTEQWQWLSLFFYSHDKKEQPWKHGQMTFGLPSVGVLLTSYFMSIAELESEFVWKVSQIKTIHLGPHSWHFFTCPFIQLWSVIEIFSNHLHLSPKCSTVSMFQIFPSLLLNKETVTSSLDGYIIYYWIYLSMTSRNHINERIFGVINVFVVGFGN